MIGLVAVLFAAGAASQPAPAAVRDACQLLTADEVRAVQEVAVKERKGSVDQAKALRFAQCVFATSDLTRSVSLTVITGTASDGARDYWKKTFHPQRSDAALAAATRKKDLPRAVPATGEEAFWTGDKRAGALYVLSGGMVLRVSVGGVTDEEERIRRSKVLAQAALVRLRGD